MVNALLEFIRETNEQIGIKLPANWASLPEVEIARKFLSGLNHSFFFQTFDGIGETVFQDEELQYFSKFHRFWEQHHAEIINAKIDSKQSAVTATALARAVKKYGKEILAVQHETLGLTPKAIAQVRFFTANQDFREPPKKQYQTYLNPPDSFDPRTITEEPEAFLHTLGFTRLSQTDKRLDFARNSARFLIDKKISAFDIASKFGNNAVTIREQLVDSPNMGYGAKKANMFIRDMVELGVWPGLSHYDEIDVASDINTMKLALRTRILKTDMQLLSSFLDTFCWQYSYIDEMSAQAWRAVWKEWQITDPKTAPRSPCVMDFLLYRIGREYCKDIVVAYKCDAGHVFYHFGAALKKCPQHRVRAVPFQRFLPCQIESQKLPREEGSLLIRGDNLLKMFDGICIFEEACQPRKPDFVAFDPPKSISIKGQTSWTNSLADAKCGGGGMMG